MLRTITQLARAPILAFERPETFTKVWRQTLTTPATKRIQWQSTRRISNGPARPTALLRTSARSQNATSRLGRAAGQGQKRGFRFSPWSRSQGTGEGAEKPLSLGARLRKLSREYGKAAVGVYFLLSVLDFPFFFLLVKAVGAERIGVVEHWITTHVIPESVRVKWNEMMAYFKAEEQKKTGEEHISDAVEKASWGVGEAQERHKEEASLGTQLALAYAIHKTFIFVRVPLTAAVTPKVVKVLRGWGWKIGNKVPR